MNDNYEPYGKEWEKEMMKHDKKTLIEYLKRAWMMRDTRELASPPGDTMQETMDCINMSFMEFQDRMQMTDRQCVQLLTGQLLITEHIAQSLESTFNIDKEFWINREKLYRDAIHQGSR